MSNILGRAKGYVKEELAHIVKYNGEIYAVESFVTGESFVTDVFYAESEKTPCDGAESVIWQCDEPYGKLYSDLSSPVFEKIYENRRDMENGHYVVCTHLEKYI